MIITARAAARFASTIALLLAPAQAFAVVQDSQIWTQTNAVVPLSKQFRLTLEQISRFSDRQSGLYTTEWGGLLGYKVSKAVELGFGYRHVGFHNGNTAPDEERIRQQVVITTGRWMGRFRIDERFHPKGNEIGFRLRPLIRYNLPVGTKGVALYLNHESIFLANSTSWGQKAGYDRMRNSAGISFPIAKFLQGDVGYLNQYLFASGRPHAEMDHALNMQLTINFGALTGPLLHD